MRNTTTVKWGPTIFMSIKCCTNVKKSPPFFNMASKSSYSTAHENSKYVTRFSVSFI